MRTAFQKRKLARWLVVSGLGLCCGALLGTSCSGTRGAHPPHPAGNPADAGHDAAPMPPTPSQARCDAVLDKLIRFAADEHRRTLTATQDEEFAPSAAQLDRIRKSIRQRWGQCQKLSPALLSCAEAADAPAALKRCWGHLPAPAVDSRQ